MANVQELKNTISMMRKVGYGDITMPEDHNYLVKAVKMLPGFYPCEGLESIIPKLRTVKTKDVIEPSDHNNLVDAVKAFRDCLAQVTDTSKLDKDIGKLRTVKKGDAVLASDHNDLVQCLKDIADLLPVMPHPWFSCQHDFRRSGYQPRPYTYLLAGNNNGSLYCYTKDGSLYWTFALGQATDNQPIISLQHNVFESTGIWSGTPTIQGISFTPTLLWKQLLHGFSTGVPSFDYDGNIYVVDNGTYLTKLTQDGAIEWSVQIGPANLSTRYITNVIDKDNIIYTGDTQSTVCAVNPDGTFEWKLTLTNWAEYTALDEKNFQFYVIGTTSAGRDTLFAIDLNGIINWKFQTPSGVLYGMCVDLDGNVYLAGGANYEVYALDADGNLLWSYKTGGEPNGFPAVTPDGRLYVYCFDGNVYAFSTDGTLLWTCNVGAYPIRSPTVGSDGIIYIPYGYLGNSICAISPDGAVLWSTPSVGNIFSPGISIV